MVICRFGPDVRDALALQYHHLFRQHPAGLAVEQAAGANRDRLEAPEDIDRHRRLFPRTVVGPAPRQGAGGGAGLWPRRTAVAMNRPKTAAVANWHRIACLHRKRSEAD